MKNNNGKLIFAVLAGGAVGFALGMMLAPKKGSELRKSVIDSLDDLGDKVSQAVADGREKLMELTGMGENEEDSALTDSNGVSNSTGSRKQRVS